MTCVPFERSHQAVPYDIGLTCQDGGNPPRQTRRTIGVAILDAGPNMTSGLVVVDFADRNAAGDYIATIKSTTTDVGHAAVAGYTIKQLVPSPPKVLL